MKQYQLPVMTDAQANAALDQAVEQVRINLPLYTEKCQNHSSVDGIYPACENVQWTCGFWPGEVWLSYERTGDDAFRACAQTLVESFADRIEQKIEVDHHDMGFLYSPSCVAAYKLTGSEQGKRAAILAADQLISRFQPKGEFIQAWGAMGAPENYRHITTCLANSFRADGSTYHTFFMNPDGTPSHGATCQGYKDDSFWARGQAWGVYGSILSCRYTKKSEYLDTFRKALDFYLTRLPADLVPYWDMIFTTGTEEPRDSSSAAIVACGLLEAAKYVDKAEAEGYCKLARQMLASLYEHYAVREMRPGAGQLAHGTYSKKSPYNTCTPEGVDECTSWGDYFYMEALTRLTKDWKLYW